MLNLSQVYTKAQVERLCNLYTNYEDKLGSLKPCVKCQHVGVTCFGGNMSAVTFTEVIAWCLARKKYLGINNQTIADKSGISVHTINKLFTGNLESCNHDTITRIVKTLVDPTGTTVFSTCPFAAGEKVNDAETLRLKEQVQLLEQKLATVEEKAEARVAHEQEERAKIAAHLKEQITDMRHQNKMLSRCLFVAVVALVSILLADIMLPFIGWIQR